MPLRGALKGAALAGLTYIALYDLGITKLGGLAFLPWLWAATVAGAAIGALGIRSGPDRARGTSAQIARVARRTLWSAAVAVVALLLVVSSTPVLRPLMRPLMRYDLPRGAPLPADVDGIAVLSSVQRENGLVAEEGVERLLHALALARASGRPLLVSVIHPPGHPDVSSLPDQRALAALAGVTALLTVDSVHVTRDEAVHMAAVARRERWRRVALVTSPLHSRRACATFERAGVSVLCVPSPSRSYELDGPRQLPPGYGRLRAFGAWIYETIGTWSYRARGWM